MFHVQSFQRRFNRVLLSSVFFILLGYSFLTPSEAANISNVGQWKNLNSVSKTAYTAGVIDAFLSPLHESSHHEMFISKFKLCLKELNITTFEIARMIDNFYLNEENWIFSPQAAIKFQLVNGHCFQFFNN